MVVEGSATETIQCCVPGGSSAKYVRPVWACQRPVYAHAVVVEGFKAVARDVAVCFLGAWGVRAGVPVPQAPPGVTAASAADRKCTIGGVLKAYLGRVTPALPLTRGMQHKPRCLTACRTGIPKLLEHHHVHMYVRSY